MLKYEKFKAAIHSIIQQSGLDIGMVYFILKDITRQLEVLYLQQIQKEAQEENDKEENETKI